MIVADPRQPAQLRQYLRAAQAPLNASFLAGSSARALLTGRARIVDRVLTDIWRALALPDDLALVAVGGYGRGELYPASDVDILILAHEGHLLANASAIERLIGLLWDIGLEIGHSVRTIAECLDAASHDITVQTTLLEARLLCGNASLFEDFKSEFRHRLDPIAFYKAKRLEQEERYTRHADTIYSLEPNCKESPGGLRDLQIILWLTQAAGLGNRWRELAKHGLMREGELRQLQRAEDFLHCLRIRLHLLTGRREDRLLFDHQESLASQFGLQARGQRRASELFMQRYYRNAKLVTQLNTLLLQNIGQLIFPGRQATPIVIDEHFQMVQELLDMRDEDLFERQPRAILEAFLLMEQRAELKGMTTRTLRALWRARSRLDAAFRRVPENRALFLSLFQQRRGLTHELRRMNQYDILGHYLPAFGRIVGQMQHDLFHVYTVDQHILQVIRNLRRFTLPEYAHEYPLCSRLIASFDQPWLLYLAALFHDIAKGRGGDHSVLGMRDAHRFCRGHGLSEAQSALIVFLVREHLTMSRIAQKEDLADPDVIRHFADIVAEPRRLDALYLFTVADIRGTSPKVWNAWKGKLLEDLYRATLRVLRGGAPAVAGGEDKQQQARARLRLYGLRAGTEDALWRRLDTAYFLRHDAEEIAWHARQLWARPDSMVPIVRARLNPIGEGLQVMVYMPDSPRLFARLCGFFARLGFSIAEAKIHTTGHGHALDSFVLLDAGDPLPYRDMIAIVEHELTDELTQQKPLDAPTTCRLPRKLRHFPLEPMVAIRPTEKGDLSLLSITAADRPGLLYALALILADHDIKLHTARITTLGERVEDSFLISGQALAHTASLVQLEQELLGALR